MAIRQSSQGPGILRNVRNLVLVAGHAIFVGDKSEEILDDASWLLEPYQQDEPRFFQEHIKAGVELAAADPRSLLLFSGGRTRQESRRSEAAGYRVVAELREYWGNPDIPPRTELEVYARDSLENLLFGLCRFRELAGRYPEHTTIVSWKFKGPRFEMHREALAYPGARFRFVGSENPLALEGARSGEAHTRSLYAHDPLGLGDELLALRRARNPHGATAPYPETNPELSKLLSAREQSGEAGHSSLQASPTPLLEGVSW